MKTALVAVVLVAAAVTLASLWQRPIYEASAQESDSPVSPKPLRNGLLALVIGSVLCAVAARSSGTPRLVGMLDQIGTRLGGALGVWNARRRVSQTMVPAVPPPDPREAERVKETVLLQALGRCGKLTVVEAALETSLSVAEAERMLSELASKGHLEVTVEHGRLHYSLWRGRGEDFPIHPTP
jgi:hypothetical protein